MRNPKAISIVFMMWSILPVLPEYEPHYPSKTLIIVFLGTRTPNPDPQHSGKSVAFEVKDTSFIIDFGLGLVRQAAVMPRRLCLIRQRSKNSFLHFSPVPEVYGHVNRCLRK